MAASRTRSEAKDVGRRTNYGDIVVGVFFMSSVGIYIFKYAPDSATTDVQCKVIPILGNLMFELVKNLTSQKAGLITLMNP